MRPSLLPPIALLALAAGCALITGPAQRPPTTEKFDATPERLARGQYLVEHVSTCLYCHSEHDWTRYTAPVLAQARGRGGVCVTDVHDAPGRICTQNLSSDAQDGVGGWTDGELLRAMREGVSRDGRALFPSMPYGSYAHLSDEDAKAVVTYLRTVAPQKGGPPRTEVRFPTRLFIKLQPRPLEGPVAPPPAEDSVARGRYLAYAAGCEHCHTPRVRGDVVPNRDFAGGFVLKGPWGKVVSANISSHPETGIGRYTKEEFISRFKSFAEFDLDTPARSSGATVMPWREFSGMTEEDLGAIYDFLKTTPPVDQVIDTFPEPGAGVTSASAWRAVR